MQRGLLDPSNPPTQRALRDVTLCLAEGKRGTYKSVKSTTFRLPAGTDGEGRKRKGRTIIQFRRIDRHHPPLLAHSMGKDSRTVSLPAS